MDYLAALRLKLAPPDELGVMRELHMLLRARDPDYFGKLGELSCEELAKRYLKLIDQERKVAQEAS